MKRIAGLDGLRAFAAISVVFTHLQVYNYFYLKGFLSNEVIVSLNGGAGVQAFFVLSGFLITSILLAEYKQNEKIALKAFYIKRSLRIFPLYYLIIIITAFAELVGSNVINLESLIYAALYIYNFIPRDLYSSILGHTWSLSVEEHFYLIWPWVFIAVAAKKIKQVILCLSIILISLILSYVLSESKSLNELYFVGRWSFTAGRDIAIGCILAVIISGARSIGFVRNYGSVILVAAIVLIFNRVFLGNIGEINANILRGVGFAIFIAWVVGHPTSMLVRFLELPFITYLGSVSYGIYMYQGFFLSESPFRAPEQTWPPEQYIGLVLLIFVVPLSYHFYEKPIMSRYGSKPRH